MTTVYESNRFAFQVSWGSILAGSAVALVTYLIFSVLGTAVGAQAVDMMQKGNPLSGFGTGTGSGCWFQRWPRWPQARSSPAAPHRIAAACMVC